ncbi:Aste57867_10125 [Aphanomyces stellatus]|uniref:Aste57867_10125 protein n=1 Tax=Aphanomyces stellatus TaxID=120398 RepID=A0A485KQ80_9STRA|nr:hypothetical protein As57867_010086 [Aphanomyces stellatus]VFT87001.1 Aste57867_10125 [Aphanomyces stellatus]
MLSIRRRPLPPATLRASQCLSLLVASFVCTSLPQGGAGPFTTSVTALAAVASFVYWVIVDKFKLYTPSSRLALAFESTLCCFLSLAFVAVVAGATLFTRVPIDAAAAYASCGTLALALVVQWTVWTRCRAANESSTTTHVIHLTKTDSSQDVRTPNDPLTVV